MTNELLKEEQLENCEQTQEDYEANEDKIATDVAIIDEKSQNSKVETRNEAQEPCEANEEEIRKDEQIQEQIAQKADEQIAEANGDEKAQAISDLEKQLEKEKEARLFSESQLLCYQLLEKENLPKELALYLTANTPEETEKIITGVGQVIKKAINKGVLSRLATVSAPTRSKNEMTREQFKTLSLAQRQQLYKTDKELYKQLSEKIN